MAKGLYGRLFDWMVNQINCLLTFNKAVWWVLCCYLTLFSGIRKTSFWHLASSQPAALLKSWQ
jgi:hypothetical protein